MTRRWTRRRWCDGTGFLRGFQPQTPGYFSLVGKVTKSTPACGWMAYNFVLLTRRHGFDCPTEGHACNNGSHGSSTRPPYPIVLPLLWFGSVLFDPYEIWVRNALSPVFAPCFFIEADRFLYPIHRATAEVRPDTRHRSDARRISDSAAGCIQGPTQSDQTRGSKTVGLGVFLGTFCTSKSARRSGKVNWAEGPREGGLGRARSPGVSNE